LHRKDAVRLWIVGISNLFRSSSFATATAFSTAEAFFAHSQEQAH